MTITILYFSSCRRERLREAFAHNLQILGPGRTAAITEALQRAYQPRNSTRTNYNFALHALDYIVGLQGLNAIALVKEAWNVGSLTDTSGQEPGPEPVADITHPSTNAIQ